MKRNLNLIKKVIIMMTITSMMPLVYTSNVDAATSSAKVTNIKASGVPTKLTLTVGKKKAYNLTVKAKGTMKVRGVKMNTTVTSNNMTSLKRINLTKSKVKKSYKVKSNKTSVAKVSKSGNKITIKALKKGTATITIKYEKKTIRKIKVTVKSASNSKSNNNSSKKSSSNKTKCNHNFVTVKSETKSVEPYTETKNVEEWKFIEREYWNNYPYFEITGWTTDKTLQFDNYHHIGDIICYRVGFAEKPSILNEHPQWEHYTPGPYEFGNTYEKIPYIVKTIHTGEVKRIDHQKCSKCNKTRDIETVTSKGSVKTEKHLNVPEGTTTVMAYTSTQAGPGPDYDLINPIQELVPHKSFLDWIALFTPGGMGIGSPLYERAVQDFQNFGEITCTCEWCTKYK